ncbi:MAG TPA: DinB family protein [Roseiflexaceae bacterium]|nr:DinB family protein [Roseiflexaceae bacterium]
MHADVRTATIPQLIPLVEQLSSQVEAQLRGLSAAQLNWKPNPAEWSLGQCLDHLITANTSYFGPLERLLAGQHVTTFWERLPLAPALFGRLLIYSLHPNQRRRVRTARVFEPTQSAVDQQILPAFAQQQRRLVELMRACAGLDAGRVIITSPALSFVTYSLLDAFRIIVIHEQHHLVQTAKILGLPEFPGGRGQGEALNAER